MKRNKIIRKSFLLPFSALSLLIMVYFLLFFEIHLKYLIEKSLFESLGSEVNISKLSISPLNESLTLSRIQFTDPDKPEQNIFEINRISIDYVTKKLLDLSFQSNLLNVSEIKFHTKRSYKGRVLDKDKRIIVLKDPSAHKISSALDNKFDKNSFFKLTKSLKGDLSKEELSKLSESFDSSKFYKQLSKKEEEIKNEIKALEDKVSSKETKDVLEKIKNFKFNSDSTQESLVSTAESLKIIKKTERIKEDLKSKIEDINNKIDQMVMAAKNAPKNLKNDLLMLQNDYKSLDPAVLSKEIFGSYFAIQISKMARFKTAITDSAYDQVERKSSVDLKKHISKIETNNDLDKSSKIKSENAKSDNFSRGKLEERRSQLISENGRWFKFKKNAEPKFWLKKITISSKSSKGQDIGDVEGEIKNLTSDQDIINEPLEIEIKGSAPKQDIGFFSINGIINKINPLKEKQNFDIKIADYKIKDFEVFSDNDAFLNFKESQAQTIVKFTQSDDVINLNLTQVLKPAVAAYDSDNKTVNAILKEVSTLSPLELSLSANGDIKNPDIKVETNIVKKLLASIKNTGKNLISDEINKEVSKIQDKFLSKYLPEVEDSESSLKKQSLSVERQLSLLFDEEIRKLKFKTKTKTKTSKNKDLDKLKNKLLDKIKL